MIDEYDDCVKNFFIPVQNKLNKIKLTPDIDHIQIKIGLHQLNFNVENNSVNYYYGRPIDDSFHLLNMNTIPAWFCHAFVSEKTTNMIVTKIFTDKSSIDKQFTIRKLQKKKFKRKLNIINNPDNANNTPNKKNKK